MRTLLTPCLWFAVLSTMVGCTKTEEPAKPVDTKPTMTAPVVSTGASTAMPPAASSTAVLMPKPAESAGPRDMMSRLDSDMKKVIDQLGALGGKPIETLTPEEARKQPTPADAVKELLKKEGKPTAPEEVGKVEDRKIAVNGAQIPVRIYTPKKGKGPFPLVVYYHGGGFVIASNDVYDATPRALANAVEAVVVSVDYRRAPENKFPTAHDDAFAAYQWALKNAASIGADPKRVAVAGESAGGNLATNVALMARDKKETMPLHALLVYPVASSDMNAPSYIENASAKPLNKAMMSWFTEKYFRTPADGNDPRINLVAADLKGLPTVTIVNAEIDPLKSDGDKLADKLKAAGVSVDHKVYEGVVHEFFGMGAVVSDAKDAMNYAAGRLKKSLEKP